MLKQKIIIVASLLAFSIAPAVQADSTLVYELQVPGGEKIEHTISISGRWLRLDTIPKRKFDYTIMDLGRLIMFDVNDEEKSYQLTRMGRLYWPSTALNSPRFKAVTQKHAVAGVRCQPVNEIAADNQIITRHCMTTGGAMGLNAREMISLSRLFMSARRLGFNWPGVATPDERQVSILSESAGGITQQFKSVSHGQVDSTKFKVPVSYQRLKPDLPPVKK